MNQSTYSSYLFYGCKGTMFFSNLQYLKIVVSHEYLQIGIGFSFKMEKKKGEKKEIERKMEIS